jgi:hypothetical protein
MMKLQAELDQAMPDPHAIPDIALLQKLPYLNAFVKEGRAALRFNLHLPPYTCHRSSVVQRRTKSSRTCRSIFHIQKWRY